MNISKFNGFYFLFGAFVFWLLDHCKAEGLHPNDGAAFILLVVVYIYARCRFAIAEYKSPKRQCYGYQ